MEAGEAAAHAREASEQPTPQESATDRFRTRAAMGISVLAMLLAIASLAGEHAAKEMTNANILASDTWAFYQAKNIRQTVTLLITEELQTTARLQGVSLDGD